MTGGGVGVGLHGECGGCSFVGMATGPKSDVRAKMQHWSVIMPCRVTSTHVEVVSPQLKLEIWQGRNVNMASLLIPYFVSEHELSNREIFISDGVAVPFRPHRDAWLLRSLALPEFIKAFNIFRNVMCEKFDRRKELDSYLGHIVEMATLLWVPQVVQRPGCLIAPKTTTSSLIGLSGTLTCTVGWLRVTESKHATFAIQWPTVQVCVPWQHQE